LTLPTGFFGSLVAAGNPLTGDRRLERPEVHSLE
jgi:hypothetical protein